MSNTKQAFELALGQVSWCTLPVSGWRTTAHASRPADCVLNTYWLVCRGVFVFQVGSAEAQLEQPKRATLCTLPWLSVCCTSTGFATYGPATVPELLAWLLLPLVSDHVLMASPTLPVMPLALSSSSFDGSG